MIEIQLVDDARHPVSMHSTGVSVAGPTQKAWEYKPTASNALGPFYKPDAPLRSKVGEGFVLAGVVKSAADCSPIPEARIEFWLAGLDGKYHDAQRATVISGNRGEYKFESNSPPPYMSRPSHVHVKVTAKGFKVLVTQYYSAKGEHDGEFDLVLEPAGWQPKWTFREFRLYLCAVSGLSPFFGTSPLFLPPYPRKSQLDS